MDRKNKDSLVENLSAAALLGLLALLVASTSFLVDGHEGKAEQETLAELGRARISGKALIASDSSFRSVYPLVRKGRPLYGTILSIGDRYGRARVAAIVAADGHVDSIKVLGVVPAASPFGREGWFDEFVGKGGDDSFPTSRGDLRKPDTVSAATDSLFAASEAFSRLSGYVTGLADRAEGN